MSTGLSASLDPSISTLPQPFVEKPTIQPFKFFYGWGLLPPSNSASVADTDDCNDSRMNSTDRMEQPEYLKFSYTTNIVSAQNDFKYILNNFGYNNNEVKGVMKAPDETYSNIEYLDCVYSMAVHDSTPVTSCNSIEQNTTDQVNTSYNELLKNLVT